MGKNPYNKLIFCKGGLKMCEDENPRIFKCPICGKEYKALGWLESHFMKYHGLNEYYAEDLKNAIFQIWHWKGFDKNMDNWNEERLQKLLKSLPFSIKD